MANHGYIHLKKRITIEQVKKDTMAVLEAKFPERNIRDGRYLDVALVLGDDGKILSVGYGDKSLHGFWLRNSKTIEFRHGNPYPAAWIERIIINGLAAKYDGTISDDGCGEERWKPTPETFANHAGDIEFRGHSFRKAVPADFGIAYFGDIDYSNTKIDLVTEEELQRITAEEI